MVGTDWREKDVVENRWEIHHILGGGMGVVYVMYDREWHEAFAAKTFQERVFARNPAIVGLFIKEAQTWINLDAHENVTRARFVHVIAGRPFLMLEYVSGGDLSGWIGTPRLTEDLPQVLRFAIQFSDGMIHAQAKGVAVHRDIKPQNCLVTENGTLKVTDFGLAKVFDAPGDDGDPGSSDVYSLAIQGSRTGMHAGTATHMAPEQFVDAKHVDVRADIYSFGVMLFQMLTGRLPFEGQTWQELERQHRGEPAPRLGSNYSGMRGVVERCLSKEPEARFGNFGEVRERFEEIYTKLTGAPAPAPAVGPELSANDWNNKGTSLAHLDRREEAVACFDRSLEIDARQFHVWGNRGGSMAALGRHEEALACFDRSLAINPHHPTPWLNKGAALEFSGRHEEALACFERALEINPHDAEAWYNRGNSLAALGRREEALASFNRALEINPRRSLPWLNKGAALAVLEQHEEALVCFGRALEINQHEAKAWYNRGNSVAALGRPEEALVCFERALEINPFYVDAWNNKGGWLAKLDRPEEALPCFNRVLEIDPRNAGAWYNKGLILGNSWRVREALPCFQEAQRLGSPEAAESIALCQQMLNLGLDKGRQPLAERHSGDENEMMPAVDGLSIPHPIADPERAARLNIQYQQDLAQWKSLSWFKRLRTPKPQPPSGI